MRMSNTYFDHCGLDDGIQAKLGTLLSFFAHADSFTFERGVTNTVSIQYVCFPCFVNFIMAQ